MTSSHDHQTYFSIKHKKRKISVVDYATVEDKIENTLR
jgi:hypothetical protein